LNKSSVNWKWLVGQGNKQSNDDIPDGHGHSESKAQFYSQSVHPTGHYNGCISRLASLRKLWFHLVTGIGIHCSGNLMTTAMTVQFRQNLTSRGMRRARFSHRFGKTKSADGCPQIGCFEGNLIKFLAWLSNAVWNDSLRADRAVWIATVRDDRSTKHHINPGFPNVNDGPGRYRFGSVALLEWRSNFDTAVGRLEPSYGRAVAFTRTASGHVPTLYPQTKW